VNSPAAAESRLIADFERRASRAELLAREAAAARELLEFAAGLYRAQGRLAGTLIAAHSRDPFSGRFEQDAGRLLEGIGPILRYAEEAGPEPLAEEAERRRKEPESTVRTRLAVYWGGGRSSGEDYLSRAILRPYVELLRTGGLSPDRPHRRGACPFCGGLPWIAARREGSLTEGARRMLGCALCGGEWLVGRILCPSCREEDPRKLPAFQDGKNPSVRIEACETCRRYVKSLDLSEDARPIPEVDDLVSIAMDLWAVEQGFTRIEPGLAGI
jgi:formate dehydrogenase maturation protein FdhE